MTEQEKAELRGYAQAWERASLVLERLRRESLRRVDVRQVIEELDDAFVAALRGGPAQELTGLVEQQAIFGRLRK